MLTILALLILPLIATVFAAWNRSASAQSSHHFAGRRARISLASLHCLVSRQNPFPKRLVVGRGPIGWFFSHNPVAHVRSRGALLTGISPADAGAGI